MSRISVLVLPFCGKERGRDAFQQLRRPQLMHREGDVAVGVASSAARNRKGGRAGDGNGFGQGDRHIFSGDVEGMAQGGTGKSRAVLIEAQNEI